MKHLILFLLVFMTVSSQLLQAQVDTIGVYRLIDGGGDPTIKYAVKVAPDLQFTDYTRVGVTASSGSGFFVSKGFPYAGADYDETKMHTFTITPQNGATLYIKKLSMNHKRSGSNPNPGNTVNFKCVVQYENKEYEFGSGTTLNPTAWFHADNLKILTTQPVTFKFYAKDLFDAAQSWMQRNVSLIGASIPQGTDPEEVIGSLEPTYGEVAKDYVNTLTFFGIEAEGAVAPAHVYDMGGMPLTYTFLVNDRTDLTHVRFNYSLPAGTTLDEPLNTDFSTISKRSAVLRSSWGYRKVFFIVKKVTPDEKQINLTFDASNNPSTWNEAVKGWLTQSVTVSESGVTQFNNEDAVLVVASKANIESVAFDISLASSGAFTGMFSVESSSDGVEWESVRHFNGCDRITSNVQRFVENLPANSKYVRFTYDCQNSHAIVVNNIVTAGSAGSVDQVEYDNSIIYPNPAKDIVFFSAEQPMRHLILYSANGTTILQQKGDIRQFDVSALQPGMYTLKTTDILGQSYTYRLIIE